MIIGLFSDIHANWEALEACLAHARSQGVERYAFLGDFVGYGAEPQRVVEIIERYAAEGALAIKGNHDEAIVRNAAYMDEAAKASIVLARQALSSSQRAFLASLPLCIREEEMCFVHASADAPSRWDYVDSAIAAAKSAAAAGTAYTFSGHVHDQQLYFRNAKRKMISFRPISGTRIPVSRHRLWLALVGSVGQPRDGNPAAAYALFDRRQEKLTFFRVPYDHFGAAAKIRRAGLPASLAYRLENGA